MLKDKLKKKRTLVVDDVMLDIYFEGDVKQISPEAPTPVLLKKSERFILGGAANVAANLIAAGQSASLLSIIGNDPNGERLQHQLESIGADCTMLIRSNSQLRQD